MQHDIDSLISAVVVSLRTRFPELIRCQSLAGYIETTSPADIHKDTPGVYVASLGTGDVVAVETGERDIVVRMVAYLISVSEKSQQREVQAQILITNLLDHISWQRWGLPNAHPAREVQSNDVYGLTENFEPHIKDWRLDVSVLARAADLYGGDDPVSYLTLWAITWEQMLRVGTNIYDNNDSTVPYQFTARFNPREVPPVNNV